MAPAYADEAGLQGRADTADVSTRTIEVPVPDGVVPRRLVGKVRVTSEAGVAARGDLEVLVAGRVAATLPPRPRSTLRTQVRRSDVSRDGTLQVGLRWADACAPAGLRATLDDLRLVHGGEEDAPANAREFFAGAVSRVDVVVPRSAGDDVLEAALEVTALLTRHYGDRVRVATQTADAVLPRVGAGQRVLRLAPAPSVARGLEQRFGLWTLTLQGPGEQLRDAVAQALPRPGPTPEPAAAQSLAALGADRVSLGGWGTTSTRVPLPQDVLGGVADGLALHLEGSHSAVAPGTLARLDVRVDGALVESVDLAASEGTEIDLDLEVPASRLRASNLLELSLTAVPDGGCDAVAGALPVEVDLDAAASTVTAGRGESPLTGLQRMPASLAGELPVAIGATGRERAAALADAGVLVAALQRVAGLPLDIDLVDVGELVTGDMPGLLVGAEPEDALAVQAPVRLVAGGEVDLLTDDESFAALQLVRHRDRDLLVLGSWAPGGDSAAPLARRLVAQALTEGWSALEGGALVLPETGRALSLDPAPATDTPDGAEGEDDRYAAYLIGAAALLLVLLGIQLTLVIRKDRRVRAEA